MRKSIYTQAVDGIKAPDRAVGKMLETARNSKSKEKIIDMKNFRKAVIAASLAAVLAVGGAFGISIMNPKAENAFVLKVNAAELGGDNTAEIGINEDKGLSLSEGSDSIAAYSIGMPMICEGKNIDTVTYSVDSGVLVVSSRKDNDPVISGVISKDKRRFPYSVSMTEKDRKAINAIIEKESPDGATPEQNAAEDAIWANYTQEVYSSVTFAYDNQKPEGSCFSYAGFAEDLSEEDYNYLKAHKDELYNIYGDEKLFDAQRDCVERIIGKTVHCTVRFKDGSEQTQDVKIGTTVSIYSKEFPGEANSLPEDIKKAKDYKGVFVTYSIEN